MSTTGGDWGKNREEYLPCTEEKKKTRGEEEKPVGPLGGFPR